MPSKSPAQHRLMQAVAHNSEFARKVGIPQDVGKEFADADEAKAKPKKPTDYGAMTRRLMGMAR